MTRKEAAEILAILKAAYPGSYNNMTKQEAMGTVSVWALQFSDISPDIVLMAVQKLISTSKFPPSIAEVKAKLESVHWEAYEKINGSIGGGNLPESERKQYMRIYEETRGYKFAKMAEPPIAQMIHGADGRQLLNE